LFLFLWRDPGMHCIAKLCLKMFKDWDASESSPGSRRSFNDPIPAPYQAL